MPTQKSSLADIIVDGETLLAALDANPVLLPNIEDARAPLELSLAEIKSLTFRERTLTGDRQQAVQDRRAAVLRSRDQSRVLRDFIRSKLGARSEKLVEFRVQPLRKRKGRKAPAETPPPGSDPQPTP
jgi:hypothetical protein